MKKKNLKKLIALLVLALVLAGLIVGSVLLKNINEAEEEEAAEETDALTRKDYDFLKKISPNTLTILHGYAEPAIRDCESGTSFQFVRVGYFCKDPDSTSELPVFNRTVELNGLKL